MKKVLIITIFFVCFYIFLFIISKNINKYYLLGFGWKVYLKKSEIETKSLKIGEIKGEGDIFIKKVKIYPEDSGILSFDLKKNLTKINLENPLLDTIRVISKKSGVIYMKVQYERRVYDFINYAFTLPIRIDEVKFLIPIKILEVSVE